MIFFKRFFSEGIYLNKKDIKGNVDMRDEFFFLFREKEVIVLKVL